jgi:O-antigen/teichoic acid export membrane protein
LQHYTQASTRNRQADAGRAHRQLGRTARGLKRLSAPMDHPQPESGNCTNPAQVPESFWRDDQQVPLIARNVLSQYVVLGVSMGLGLVMLPFNVAHLGPSAYGLWVLVTSMTTYFDVLELGYGSAQVKFTAQYRARRDPGALNEVTSTLFFLFVGIALIKYAFALFVAFNIGTWFNLGAEQAMIGRYVLLIVSAYFAISLPFSVYGSVTNGFQRYHLNNAIFVVTSIAVAIVNVVVLLLGYGIVELVASTTLVRLLSLAAYRRSAYKAFPLLRIRWAHARKARLKEVTAFSAILLIIDIANKVSYTADTVIIGAFMSTAAVAVWSVGQRLAVTLGRFTRVLSEKLFPTIVDTAALDRRDRLQMLLVQGTRLSLAMVIPLASFIALLAQPIVMAWVGPRFVESVPVLQILALVVTIKVGAMTAQSMLKGTENHRFLAACTSGVAIANLALSIVLLQRFGLVGVAFGTLIPAATVLLFVVFPKACRVVHLPVGHALRTAVWPAVWPAIPAGVLLMAFRSSIAMSTGLTALTAAFAMLMYGVTFLRFAIPVQERRWYGSKISALLRRPAVLLPS